MSATATVYTKRERPDWTSSEVNEMLKWIASGAISERRGTELINNRCGTRVSRSTVRRRVEMMRCCMNTTDANMKVHSASDSQQEALVNGHSGDNSGEGNADGGFNINNVTLMNNPGVFLMQKGDWASDSINSIEMYCVVKYREAHAFAVVDDKQVVGSRIVGDIVYVHYEEGRYQAVLLYRTVSILEATGRCNELIMNNNKDLVMAMRRKKSLAGKTNGCVIQTDCRSPRVNVTDGFLQTSDSVGLIKIQSLLDDVNNLRQYLDRIEYTLAECLPNRSLHDESETCSSLVQNSCDSESGSSENISNGQEKCAAPDINADNDTGKRSDFGEGGKSEKPFWPEADLAVSSENLTGSGLLPLQEVLDIKDRSGAVLTFARNLATKLFFDENALIRLCQRLNNERMSWMREVVNICYPISSEESEAERWQLIVQTSQDIDRLMDDISMKSKQRTNGCVKLGSVAVVCKQESNVGEYDGDLTSQDATSVKSLLDVLLLASGSGAVAEAGASQTSPVTSTASDNPDCDNKKASAETSITDLFSRASLIADNKRFPGSGCRSKKRDGHRETSEERASRLSRDAERARRRRERESSAERAIRLAKCALRARMRRERETSEERTVRLAREAASARYRRRRETPEERQRRLMRMRGSHLNWWNNLSKENRTQQWLKYIRQLPQSCLLAKSDGEERENQ